MDRVLILDFGSQVTQLIARRIRNQGVYCEIYPYNTSRKKIENEIADIFNYVVKFVDMLNMDLEKAALEKIKRNAEKYPIDKAKGKSKKYQDL